jgi:hypothetical protein
MGCAPVRWYWGLELVDESPLRCREWPSTHESDSGEGNIGMSTKAHLF